ALWGCSTNPRGQQMSMKIEPEKDGEWSVQVTRRHEDTAATGAVVIRHVSEPDAASPPHVALAGARAWLALGTEKLATKRIEDAVYCARAGLSELGTDYAPQNVEDDTDLKLHAAEELVKTGRAENGAAMMLRMLSTRIQLYAQRYAADIVK